MDHSAHGSMKNAASCETWCELQDTLSTDFSNAHCALGSFPGARLSEGRIRLTKESSPPFGRTGVTPPLGDAAGSRANEEPGHSCEQEGLLRNSDSYIHQGAEVLRRARSSSKSTSYDRKKGVRKEFPESVKTSGGGKMGNPRRARGKSLRLSGRSVCGT